VAEEKKPAVTLRVNHAWGEAERLGSISGGSV